MTGHAVVIVGAGPTGMMLPAAWVAELGVPIRPDGYVAWVGDLTQPGLKDALTTWFGPPRS